MGDPRMSDREMAAINAAAVTKEYRVQPHLGTPRLMSQVTFNADPSIEDYRTVSAING